MKKTGSFLKKVLSIVLVIVMVAGMTTLSPIGKVTASAANNVTAGGFTLTSALTLSASDYSYDSTTNILTITSGKSVSISTTAATSDKIVVDSSAGAAITLNGAYIATSDGAALEIKSGTMSQLLWPDQISCKAIGRRMIRSPDMQGCKKIRKPEN